MIVSFVSSFTPEPSDTFVVVVVSDFRDLEVLRAGDALFLLLAGDLLFDLVLERLLERDPEDFLFVFFILNDLNKILYLSYYMLLECCILRNGKGVLFRAYSVET